MPDAVPIIDVDQTTDLSAATIGMTGRRDQQAAKGQFVVAGPGASAARLVRGLHPT
jgi:hypothetical protein